MCVRVCVCVYVCMLLMTDVWHTHTEEYQQRALMLARDHSDKMMEQLRWFLPQHNPHVNRGACCDELSFDEMKCIKIGRTG